MRVWTLAGGVALAVLLGAVATGQQAAGGETLKWFKGNTHTHSLNSDGDSTPVDVVQWYREQRYHFLFFTDHNTVTPIDGLNAVFGAPERFLVIRGEEITDSADKKPVHLNMLGGEGVVAPKGARRRPNRFAATSPLSRQLGASSPSTTRISGGRMTATDLARGQGRGTAGDPQRPLSGEQRGGRRPARHRGAVGQHAERRHHHLRRGQRRRPRTETPMGEDLGAPGVGLDCRPGAPAYRRRDPRGNRAGRFLCVDRSGAHRHPGDAAAADGDDQGTELRKYRVQFIGKGGRVLAEMSASPSHYDIVGNEGYVRARVLDSNGQMAWTQPVFVRQGQD